MEIRNLRMVRPYITKDGTEIYELFHPSNSDIKDFSVAIAKLKKDERSIKHKHTTSQEIYYILKGKGRMYLDGKIFEVSEGDCIYIPAQKCHQIENLGDTELMILCFSFPAYSHEDTILLN